MDKQDVIDILEEIGTFLEIKGENPFKCNAYHNAARQLEMYDGTLEHMISSGDINNIKGIGKSIAEKVTTLAQSGRLEYYEELRKAIPPGVVEMLEIPGFGSKKAKAVYEKLGIKTVGELEYACRENRLLDLDGFGLKSQQNILQGIEFIKKRVGQFHFNVAYGAAQTLFEALKAHSKVIRVSLAGSIRRHKEIVRDIDILVSAKDNKAVMSTFVSLGPVEHVVAHGDTKSSVTLKTGINADLRAVSDKQFPYALHYFTGSKAHNIAVRTRAKQMGIKMNEYGLFKGKRETLIPCKDEEEIFKVLGLHYIDPELREDTGELEAAEKGILPKLVEEHGLRGVFHVHTDYSDGVVHLKAYVKAAKERGYEYIGIADHSKSAAYANGLTEQQIREQHREIDALNKSARGVRLLKGIEVDILPDGSLDYSDKVLASFDFVIASVHSRFNMSEADMTRRIIEAMRNKYVNMLGHPTGRLLLAREAYPLDMRAVIEAAAKYHVSIELNAHPFRLDIDWRWCKKAKDAGVKISINPDAHNLEGLNDTQYGVGIARKGWLSAGDVLNTLPLEKLLHELRQRRK